MAPSSQQDIVGPSGTGGGANGEEAGQRRSSTERCRACKTMGRRGVSRQQTKWCLRRNEMISVHLALFDEDDGRFDGRRNCATGAGRLNVWRPFGARITNAKNFLGASTVTLKDPTLMAGSILVYNTCRDIMGWAPATIQHDDTTYSLLLVCLIFIDQILETSEMH